MISAVILTKDEEKNIEDCIKCLSFCDEVVVIDDNSSDKTVEIAKRLGAKVFVHPLENDFSQQRNFGLQKASGEWVLFIDADERVSKDLQKEILEIIKDDAHRSGYYIKRYDDMWGKFVKYGETGNIYFLRLARKNSGKWIGKVHETWVSIGKTAELKNPLYHYPHVTVEEFLKEINFYSTIRAEELFENKVKTNWIQIILYPNAKFLVNYVLKRGFLDGIPGLVFALLMSFHSFLVRGKLWLLWENR